MLIRTLLAVAFLLVIAPAARAEQVTILSPANGTLTSNPLEPHHRPFGGDWSVDIANGAVNTPVYARFANPTGNLSLTAIGTFEPCASPNQGKAGVGLKVRVAVDGVVLGWVAYLHLASIPVANGAIANGAQIGVMSGGTSSSCWTGRHVHMEPRNEASYSCFQSTPLGTGLNGGSVLGVLGGTWAGGVNGLCPGGATNAGSNPIGAYDTVTSPEAGVIRVTGWTYDPDAPTASNEMHVYVGGQAGTPGSEGQGFVANASRPDVAAAFPGVGAAHGLDRTFETAKTGPTPVCVYAINIGGGSNVLLGCKTINVENPNPRGNYDAVSSPEGGTVLVQGWTYDPNIRTSPASVHVYIGGEFGTTGIEGAHVFSASVSRPDVAAAFPGVGSEHGIDQTLKTSKRGSQPVCVYAINAGPGSNLLLGCKTVTIGEPPPPPPPVSQTPVVAGDQAPVEISAPAPSVEGTPAPVAALRRVTLTRSGRVVRMHTSGIADGTRLTVRITRSGRRVLTRTVRVTRATARVTVPARAGRYVVRVSLGGKTLASGSLRVR